MEKVCYALNASVYVLGFTREFRFSPSFSEI